jgi:hypothetical protein
MVRSIILDAEKNLSGPVIKIKERELPKQDNYQTAYKEAAAELSKKNLDDIAEKSGTSIISQNSKEYLLVPFLNEKFIVSHPDININYQDNNKEVPLWLKILLLHYLVCSNGKPLTNNQITFKQITGGLGYYSAFQRRAIKPILKVFAGNFEKFVNSCNSLGGSKLEEKYSVYFQVFPRVGISFNIWEQDEDFPAEGNVVFDSSISEYLSTEDIVVMCNMIAVMIVKNKS